MISYVMQVLGTYITTLLALNLCLHVIAKLFAVNLFHLFADQQVPFRICQSLAIILASWLMHQS